MTGLRGSQAFRAGWDETFGDLLDDAEWPEDDFLFGGQSDDGTKETQVSAPFESGNEDGSTQDNADLSSAANESLRSSEGSEGDNESDSEGEHQLPTPSRSAGFTDIRRLRYEFTDSQSFDLATNATEDEALRGLRDRNTRMQTTINGSTGCDTEQPVVGGQEELDVRDSDCEDDESEQAEQSKYAQISAGGMTLKVDHENSTVTYSEGQEESYAWTRSDQVVLEQHGECFTYIVEAVANGASPDEVANIFGRHGLSNEYATMTLLRILAKNVNESSSIDPTTGLYENQHLRQVFFDIKMRRRNERIAATDDWLKKRDVDIAAVNGSTEDSSQPQKGNTTWTRKEESEPDTDSEDDDSDEESAYTENSGSGDESNVDSDDEKDEDFEYTNLRSRKQSNTRNSLSQDNDSENEPTPIGGANSVSGQKSHDTENEQSMPANERRQTRQRHRKAMDYPKEKSKVLSSFLQVNGIDTQQI